MNTDTLDRAARSIGKVNGVDVTVMDVTPAIAEAWLNVNRANRALRSGVAEKYAADMEHGRWTECTAPIAFYDDGSLADGQHRLFAITMSGETQRFIVMRGLSREAGLNIDTGLARSVVDGARISGVVLGVSHTKIAVSRCAGRAT